ncbi:zinc-binding alcohol dehydrogenase family protein [Nakamurella flava]|uniref:Zinc-binding alcohol dehydrogenase family protein n=1 Tax=Nakamurella flava TaxID=2576308 RepID=A0A4U6QKG6_9ACTN|nr:zinc-binding alcohol dehydrogenase family protein [Nakamurella flava]TKV60598.1 zinc-binding alcohol dehydrogenase family protein [Nakamurella flava]
MRAAVITSPDAAPVVTDFAEPTAAAGETLVDVVAAGIHTVVRSRATGRHYSSTGRYPLVPGVDAVTRMADGSLHYAGMVRAPWGTLAERAAVRFTVPLPDQADPVAIAGGMNPGLSSWIPLTQRAVSPAGLDAVLVLGVTGVAGLLAVQSARYLGARRVVGVGRDAGRLVAAAQWGAEAIALTDAPAVLGDRLAQVLSEHSSLLVLDYLWGEVAELTWSALSRQDGSEDRVDIQWRQIGARAGERAALPAPLLRGRRITLSGFGLGGTPAGEIAAGAGGLSAAIADGAVLVPTRPFDLDDVAWAWGFDGPERAVVMTGRSR